MNVKNIAHVLLVTAMLVASTAGAQQLPDWIDSPGLERAMQVQERNNDALMARDGVEGTGIGYDDNGEVPALSVSYEATGYLSGPAAALELARNINDANLGYYAGDRDGDMFVPVAGQNRIYTDTNITNVELRVDYAPEPEFVYDFRTIGDFYSAVYILNANTKPAELVVQILYCCPEEGEDDDLGFIIFIQD